MTMNEISYLVTGIVFGGVLMMLAMTFYDDCMCDFWKDRHDSLERKLDLSRADNGALVVENEQLKQKLASIGDILNDEDAE